MAFNFEYCADMYLAKSTFQQSKLSCDLLTMTQLDKKKDASGGLVPRAAATKSGPAVFVYSWLLPMRDPCEVGVHVIFQGKCYRVMMRESGNGWQVFAINMITRIDINKQVQADLERAKQVKSSAEKFLLSNMTEDEGRRRASTAYANDPRGDNPYGNDPRGDNPYANNPNAAAYGVPIRAN